MKPLLALLAASTLVLATACENQEETAYRTEVGAILDKPFSGILEAQLAQNKALEEAKKLPEDQREAYVINAITPHWKKMPAAFTTAYEDLVAMGAPQSMGQEHGTLVEQLHKLADLYNGKKQLSSAREMSQIFRTIGETVIKMKITSPALRRINAGELSR